MIKRTFETSDAMDSLRAGASYIIRSSKDKEDKIEWLDTKQTQPTAAELDTEVKRLQAEWDSQEYARQRETEYPNIGDQLDALYHAGVFPADMAAKLKKVKDDNPKG